MTLLMLPLITCLIQLCLVVSVFLSSVMSLTKNTTSALLVFCVSDITSCVYRDQRSFLVSGVWILSHIITCVYEGLRMALVLMLS